MTIVKERYELLEKLGEGGMAEVYRARHLNLERDVAVKFIKADLTADEAFAARFQREAKAVARLNHPNILQIFDFDRAEDGRYFMVMELLEGQDLGSYLKSKPVSVETAIAITRSIATALHYAHQQGVIHRDIKPQNIFVTTDERIKVMDFGIARMLEPDTGESRAGLTQTGTFIGTPQYMSPEQAKAEGHVDHRTDIYSLGVMLFQMTTHRLPFEAETTVNMIMKHITEPIPSASALNPVLPPEFDALIQKAMAKEPNDRFSDMGAFIAALDTVEAEAPTDAFRLETAATVIIDEAEKPTTVGSGAEAKPDRSRMRIGLPLIAVIAVAVIGAGFLLLRGGEEESEPTAVPQSAAENITSAEDEYLFVVADFSGDEDAGVDVARRVASLLSGGEVASNIGEAFRVEQSSRVVTTQAEARALAEETNALMIVWGVYDAAGLEVVLQVPSYPENTLKEARFLIPAGDDFTAAVNDDLPAVLGAYVRALVMQKVIRDDDVLTLFSLGTGTILEGTIPDSIVISPVSALDQLILDVFIAFATGEYEPIDEMATRALGIVPDDPMLLFMRWDVNAMLMNRWERAKVDVEQLENLMPDSAVVIWMYATSAYFSGDYETLFAVTDDKERIPDDLKFGLLFFRQSALLEQGKYAAALEETYYESSDSEIIDFGFVATMRALIYEIRGDDAAAQAEWETMRQERLLETSAGMFASMMNESPPGLMVAGGYIGEVNRQDVMAVLAYQLGLSTSPDNFLLNWRRGTLYEKDEDWQAAYDHYQTAYENAPAPFPIVAYRMALLAHDHTLEGADDACDLLASAETDANTDAKFYAPLLEKIATAKNDFGCE